MARNRVGRQEGSALPSVPQPLDDGSALLALPMWQRLLPIGGAMAAVCAADLLAGQDTYLASLMSVVPPLAALLLYPMEVVVSSCLGLLLMVGLTRYDGLGDADARKLFEGTLVAYAALTLAAVFISHFRIVRTRHLVAVRTVAEAAQLALLPPPEPRVGPVRVAARYVSAVDLAQIGGDLYAVLETPYGVRALIGDVRGKGLPAVRMASLVLGAFRESVYDEPELTGVARRLERSVARHAVAGEFTTALLVQFEPPDTIELVHCGHVPALRVAGDGTAATLEPPDPWVPLGLAQLAGGKPEPWRERFAPGDRLLLCTDGVVEARRPDGSFYPLAARLPELIAAAGEDLDAALVGVHADVVRATGGPLRDDAALMLLSWAEPR
ncbi:PP2C family protein-serine/threonine phosphatase [Streptacidiphilus jiangxiensis]|uniref:Serine phosphatase RsbU, regulator of sigma subunit n=1 Tax=Streptacidiphilus jiangxiensis TaxID=235985 RepID=A0A1H7RYQ8_STRJI|nr:PP2C family protein-serine/threonine phosphatase [Streptacidiphilus jiangxiensis]SEL65238.1 Serine phosphatase RsbU, regulator of sigma subunit [Streptacidiphilus jiangxiensis]